MSTPASQTRGTRPLRRGIAVLAAVVTTAGLFASSAAADPAPSALGIGSAHTANARDSFSVPAWTDTPGAHVTTVEASLSSGSHTVDVALADADADGLWAPVGSVKLTSDGGILPALGHWAVSVTATDSAGGSLTRADAGTFDFTDRPFVDATALHATSGSHTQPSTTVSGTVYALAPGSSDPAPLGSHAVVVSRTADALRAAAAQTVRTGADGTFTTPPFPNGAGATYTVSLTGDDDQLDGTSSAPVDSGGQFEQVTVTAASNRQRVSDGQPFTVSGAVSDAGQPVADVAVRVVNDSSSGPGPLVTTDSTGHFAATLTAIADSYDGNRWSASVEDRFLGGQAYGAVAVPLPATFYGVAITLRSNGQVTATGTIGRTYLGDAGVSYSEITYLEYSPNGSTGWKAIGHVTSAGGLGEYFSVAGRGYVDGWYRVRHAQSDSFEAATSTAVRRIRTQTYVFGTNASPEPVAKGRTLSVSGTLEQNLRGWHVLARTRIYLYFLPKGGHTYQYVATGMTDAHGHVVLHGKASSDGYWQLHYFGDSTHFDSGDTDDYVDVR